MEYDINKLTELEFNFDVYSIINLQSSCRLSWENAVIICSLLFLIPSTLFGSFHVNLLKMSAVEFTIFPRNWHKYSSDLQMNFYWSQLVRLSELLDSDCIGQISPSWHGIWCKVESFRPKMALRSRFRTSFKVELSNVHNVHHRHWSEQRTVYCMLINISHTLIIIMIIVVNIHNYILTRCYVSCYVNVQDPLDGGSLQIMPSLPKLMNRITWYENVE